MFLLQFRPSRRVCRARACPRVPDLMYPSRTRAALSVYQTGNMPEGRLSIIVFLLWLLATSIALVLRRERV